MLDITNERIMVTGGAGFLGKHLVQHLIDSGCNESNITIPLIHQYDLSTESDVIRVYNDFKPTIVFHLAALVGGIGANRKHPGLFFYKNLVMGAMLMEYARINAIKKFIALGTICAYPKFTTTPFSEEDLWNGYPEETNAPYGLAKKMMLVQAQAYRQEYAFNSIYLLPVNLYGPGDNFNENSSHVIPALIRKCIHAKEMNTTYIDVWGTGEATREFLYVEDAARGIVLAAQNYNRSDPCNLGSGFEISIKDLVTLIARLSGFHGEIRWNRSQPDGQPRRCLNIEKAWREFGFKAQMIFEEGLMRTIDWYLANRPDKTEQP